MKNGTKNVWFFLSHFMAMYGLSWPCFGRFMVLDGLLGPFYCRLCVYGLLWENIDLIELVSFFLAVIDPNSFGLVFLMKKAMRID